MTRDWSPRTADAVREALTRAADRLTAAGLASLRYAVPGSDGYAPVTGTATTVHCLDVRLGPALRHPGRSTHCLLQVFDPAAPNLGLYVCYDRDDRTGAAVDEHRLPRIGARLDRTVSYLVTPVLNTALNPLDPTGRGRGVVVGCWHGRPTLTDLAVIPVTASRLLRTFRPSGQAALIWVDFHAPLAESMCRIARRFTGSRRVHLLPRTATPSRLRLPVPDNNGGHRHLGDLSDAVEAGIRLARGYLAG